jgi:hypothetical protein
VNAKNLRVIKLKRELRDLVEALEGSNGIGEEYCSMAASEVLHAQDVRHSLTVLEQLGLLTDH